jgi:hypothetical protein
VNSLQVAASRSSTAAEDAERQSGRPVLLSDAQAPRNLVVCMESPADSNADPILTMRAVRLVPIGASQLPRLRPGRY